MAKILSQVWSSISGSVGGITYFNGPHHAILARARVAPVQPGSTFQSQMRASMNGASIQWEALSEAEQILWEAYAETCTFQGKQGTYQVTGRTLYMAGRSLQIYAATRGLYVPAVVGTAPVTTGFLLPSGFNLTPAVGLGTGFAIFFAADLDDDTAFFTQISGVKSKQRHFWKGPWNTRDVKMTVVAAGAVGSVDYLNLQDGGIYFVRVKAVADDASPRVSQEWFGRIEATVTGP
ncbi:MAG: hypothetical protein KAJ55_10265 [Anaerolineales bacterium]|nr:hypothetical protein [Anaerolineales bacterium]